MSDCPHFLRWPRLASVLIGLTGLGGCTPSPIPASRDLPKACWIDTPAPTVRVTNGALAGWAYVPNEVGPANTIAVRFTRDDGLLYQRNMHFSADRADVAQALHLDQVTVRGFQGTLDMTGMAPGRYAASIEQYSGTRRFRCETAYTLAVP